MSDEKTYEVIASERAQKWVEKTADEFGIEEGEVVARKLRIHIKENKRLAADLYLDGEMDEDHLAEYFDEDEIENLKTARENRDKERKTGDTSE